MGYPKSLHKDADFEIQFYEGILEKTGDFLQALIALGDLYTKKGLHQEGLDVDKKLSRLRPEDPIILYNLACSYSLLNNVDQAFAVIKLAVKYGYKDFGYLEQDTDLSNLLQTRRFRQYLSQLKEKKARSVEKKGS